jgi:hypothetical protein
MIIRSKQYGHESPVYGMTWAHGETYFLHFGKSYGLTVVSEAEYEVIESVLNGKWYFSKMPNGKADAVLHECLMDKALFNQLFEHDEIAFTEFQHRLKAV